jgi:hypothetical protein
MEVASNPYPATLTVEPAERIANWRPLVHWLLAIPHFIIVEVLSTVAAVLMVIGSFVILFTGKLPSGIAGFQALYLRYNNRASVFGWLFMREEYPPFAFDTVASDPGDYPAVRTDVEPVLEDRNRLTSFFLIRFILVIPHFIALAILGIAAAVVVLIAFFAVLFTAKWPEGLWRFAVGYMRWGLRVNAYFYLLTDEYPPFSLD